MRRFPSGRVNDHLGDHRVVVRGQFLAFGDAAVDPDAWHVTRPPIKNTAGLREIPVLGILRARDLDEAILLINSGRYGNMSCLFTSSGKAARKFRYEAEVGNVGINVGVAAPMAFFPFSGWKESFFGDLHAQGRDAIDFYTEKKVVVERWPTDWTRKF